MRGPAPLLGIFASLAVPSTSRVPHLAAHIIARRSCDLSEVASRTHFRHARSFRSSAASFFGQASSHARPAVSSIDVLDRPAHRSSTAAAAAAVHQDETVQSIWEDVEDEAGEAFENNEAQIGAPEIPEALAAMRDLIERGHSEMMRFGLRENALTQDFIRNADDADFTAAVQLLDAEKMFNEYKHVYRHVKPSLTDQPIFRSIRSLEARFDAFSRDMDRIFGQRRAAGHKLELDACKVILRAAQVTGDAPKALHVFDTIMAEDGIQPDLECYNLLMEALNWNHVFTKSEWQELRVTPSRLQIRRTKNNKPPLRFSGHKVDFKVADAPATRSGLRVAVLSRFRELVANGLHGDEITFTNVMIAMGREGDVAGVKSILKSVWNVDVDMLNVYDEEEIESPTFYDEDAPLRPSFRLLFTIVHVFGTNNQVGLAFVLLDYVSRNYNLRIHPDVWLELCVWTRVMGVYRTQAQRGEAENEGQVDWRVFERLWQVMSDEPYNAVPDVPLLSLRVANLQRARMLDEAMLSVRQMREHAHVTKERAVELFLKMLDVMRVTQKHGTEQPLTKEFLETRHNFIIASQEYERDLQLLVVAIRRMLTERYWAGGRKKMEWATRRLPMILNEFADCIPRRLAYHTPTGYAEIACEPDRKARIRRSQVFHHSVFYDTTWLGIMRQVLDSDDHETVRARIQTMLEGGSIRKALLENNYEKLLDAVVEVLGPLKSSSRRDGISGKPGRSGDAVDIQNDRQEADLAVGNESTDRPEDLDSCVFEPKWTITNHSPVD